MNGKTTKTHMQTKDHLTKLVTLYLKGCA